MRARVAVEAGATFGWQRYTGRQDEAGIIAMRDFGASAPVKALMEEFGFTVANVVKAAQEAVARVKNNS